MRQRTDHPQGPEPGDRNRAAVALRYRPDENGSPVVLGKGEGLVADRILEMAHRLGIPVRENRNLVQVLSQLDLNQEIPPHLYRAVAEVLAFVYRSARDFQKEIAEGYVRLGERRVSEGDHEGAHRTWRLARSLFRDLGEDGLSAEVEARLRADL